MECLSRIVRSLAVVPDDKSDNTLHILKGRDEMGIVLAPGRLSSNYNNNNNNNNNNKHYYYV